jgi:hypothetical protein
VVGALGADGHRAAVTAGQAKGRRHRLHLGAPHISQLATTMSSDCAWQTGAARLVWLAGGVLPWRATWMMAASTPSTAASSGVTPSPLARLVSAPALRGKKGTGIRGSRGGVGP